MTGRGDVAHEQAAPRFSVRVLKPDYSGFVGPVVNYQTVSCTWQNLGVGVATIVGPEDGPIMQALATYRVPVPITLKAPGLPRWEGRVASVSATKETGQAGQAQVTLVDANKHLLKLLLAPVPGSPWSNQAAAAYDNRTGPLVTVAKAYLTANLARLAAEGHPLRMQVVPTVGADASPAITLRARAKTYDELFTPTMRLNGYDTRVTFWMPGDPVPAGMTLTAPILLVDVVANRDQRYVLFSDKRGGVSRRVVTASSPDAVAVVIGGPGEGTARVFQKVFAPGVDPAMDAWGYAEEWLDATDADDSATRIARGLEKLDELAGKSSVYLEIIDGQPWRAGPDKDYWIGDLVRAEFSGIEVSDRIDRVSVTDGSEGYKVSATFGSARDTETTDVRVARKVGQLIQSIRSIETGR